MAFKLVDAACTVCKHIQEELLDSNNPVYRECDVCGGETAWTPSAPNIRTSDSASYLDGQRRNDMAPHKEAARLEVARANAGDEKTKNELSKEINRVLKI